MTAGVTHMCQMVVCMWEDHLPATVVQWLEGHSREFRWCDGCAEVINRAKYPHTVVVQLPIWQPSRVDLDQLLTMELICHGISRLCSPRHA